MKPFYLTACLACLIATPTFADPTAGDWAGSYIGLSIGSASADAKASAGGSLEFDKGRAIGAHAGYLLQNGAITYGGEIAYSKFNDLAAPTFIGVPRLDHTIDLKAKLGYADGPMHIYGLLGYSWAKYEENGGVFVDADGLAFGLGAEYAVSKQVTLGLEYLGRRVSGPVSISPTDILDFDIDTVTLKAGLRF